jgi:hypothetical protein
MNGKRSSRSLTTSLFTLGILSLTLFTTGYVHALGTGPAGPGMSGGPQSGPTGGPGMNPGRQGGANAAPGMTNGGTPAGPTGNNPMSNNQMPGNPTGGTPAGPVQNNAMPGGMGGTPLLAPSVTIHKWALQMVILPQADKMVTHLQGAQMPIHRHNLHGYNNSPAGVGSLQRSHALKLR